MKKHSLAILTWLDSCTNIGWHSISDVSNFRTSEVTSVGWIIREDKHSLTISTSITENGNAADALTIPKAAIVKINKLKYYVQGKE